MLLLCLSTMLGMSTSRWEVILHVGEWPHNNSTALNLTGTTLPVANTQEEMQFSVSFCTR